MIAIKQLPGYELFSQCKTNYKYKPHKGVSQVKRHVSIIRRVYRKLNENLQEMSTIRKVNQVPTNWQLQSWRKVMHTLSINKGIWKPQLQMMTQENNNHKSKDPLIFQQCNSILTENGKHFFFLGFLCLVIFLKLEGGQSPNWLLSPTCTPPRDEPKKTAWKPLG